MLGGCIICGPGIIIGWGCIIIDYGYIIMGGGCIIMGGGYIIMGGAIACAWPIVGGAMLIDIVVGFDYWFVELA